MGEIGELLPGWVTWLGPVAMLAIGAICLALVPGLMLRRVRHKLQKPMHWTQRAQLATLGRTALMFGLVFWPAMATALVSVFHGPYAVVPVWLVLVVVDAIAVLVVMILGWRFVGRVLNQPLLPLGPHSWLQLRKWWPLGALLAIGVLAPDSIFSPWMILWTLVALGALRSLRYLAELYVLIGVAEPASGRVAAAVQRAAERSGAELPTAFVLHSHAANALALPARNLIIATSRLVNELDNDEMEAVMLHEIAHLSEARSVTRRRQLSLLAALPILAVKPLLGAGPFVLLGALALAVLLLVALSRMSAGEEQRADDEAVELSHESVAYGTALLKMHEAALIPAFVKRDPHGPLHDRLVKAGVTPDFEPITKSVRARPLLPALLAAVVVILFAALAPRIFIDIWDRGAGSHAAVAFGWRSDEVLWWMGASDATDGDYESAVVYLSESAAMGEGRAVVDLPWALAASGRCAQARTAREALIDSGIADIVDLELADVWIVFCDATG